MRYFLHSAILSLLMLPLHAADTQNYYVPSQLRIEKCSYDNKTASASNISAQNSYYRIFYGDIPLITEMPEALLPHFLLLKNHAHMHDLYLRSKENPLNIRFDSPAKISDNFYVINFDDLVVEFDPSELILLANKNILLPDQYHLRFTNIEASIKLDARIYEYILNIKIAAIKKQCKVIINLGFINPLAQNYCQEDLRNNIMIAEQEALLPPSQAHISCVICKENGANIAIIPCGHLVAHESCWQKRDKCPICAQDCKDTLKIYF